MCPCPAVVWPFLFFFLSFVFFFKKKKKKERKPRKMFRLRLSQEVQVELICPQAKINLRLFPLPTRPPSRSFVVAFSPDAASRVFFFFCFSPHSHAVYEGPVGNVNVASALIFFISVLQHGALSLVITSLIGCLIDFT